MPEPVSSATPWATSGRYATPVASRIACADTSPPSPKVSVRAEPSIRSPVTSRVLSTSAENLPAWRRGGPVLRRPGPLGGVGPLGGDFAARARGPLGELGAGDAAGEAKKVFDPGPRPRLAADRLPLDQQRLSPSEAP